MITVSVNIEVMDLLILHALENKLGEVCDLYNQVDADLCVLGADSPEDDEIRLRLYQLEHLKMAVADKQTGRWSITFRGLRTLRDWEKKASARK